MPRVFLLLVLIAVIGFSGRSLAQEATPGAVLDEFEIAPGVVAFDMVFDADRPEPTNYSLRFDGGVTYQVEPAPVIELVYVVSGTLTLQLDTPVGVTRSDATTEDIATDTEFTVSRGDYFVLHPMTGGEVRNETNAVASVSVAGIVPIAQEPATPVAATPEAATPAA